MVVAAGANPALTALEEAVAAWKAALVSADDDAALALLRDLYRAAYE